MPISNRKLFIFTYLTVLIADISSILISTFLARYIYKLIIGSIPFANFWPWGIISFIVCFIIIFSFMQLYPSILITPPEELKKIFQASTLSITILIITTFIYNKTNTLLIFFSLIWILIIFLLPICRIIAKKIASKYSWWGIEAIIFGAGKTGEMVAKLFCEKPEIGIKPIAFLDDASQKQNKKVWGIEIKGRISDVSKIIKLKNKYIAIIAMPNLEQQKWKKILENYCQGFERIIFIPNLFGISTLWVSALDLGGILGLDLRQKLFDPKRRIFKRIIDILGCIIIGLFTLPIMFIIAILIKLDSKGPIFYKHKRIGLNGRPIYIWKFRTMIENAEQKLNDYLNQHPILKKEWEQYHKLLNDPRITNIGKFLRKTSLDELPQLWNVLKGDLSLVGPRPIVKEEIIKYGNYFYLYKKVKPGITGLWQVSGRNKLNYKERVQLDVYYIRNWSIWLDIYILAKTPFEVLKKEGAV